MEIRISPLVLILSCCLVDSRSIAVARSAPLRRDIMLLGDSAAYPHFPQTAGSFARRPSVAAPFVLHCLSEASGAPLRRVRCNVCDS